MLSIGYASYDLAMFRIFYMFVVVCEQCWIPFCTTCWHSLRHDLKIPKALANDNFIGYVARFFVEHQVTWLEATIAAPVFSGLLHAIRWKPF